MSYGIKDVIKDELSGTADKLSKEDQFCRLEVCNTCDHLRKLSRQCGLCGCFIDLKVKYRNSECDADKWPF